MSKEWVLQCRHLARNYREGGRGVQVLSDINLQLHHGERVAIMGSSGAGKSTLLHLLGGLDAPSAGEVWVSGEKMSALNAAARGRLRNRMLGFVYQFHHLLPEFTALENIAMPMLIGGEIPATARKRAVSILGQVGLGQRLDHKPGELSGGERQRAAVARALVTRPACVLADEPTGNLDKKNAMNIYKLMIELNEESNTAMLVVTHEQTLAERMDRVLLLEEGRLQVLS